MGNEDLGKDWLSYGQNFYLHNNGFDYNSDCGFHFSKGHTKPEEQCKKEIAKRRKKKKLAKKNKKRK